MSFFFFLKRDKCIIIIMYNTFIILKEKYLKT